jgi:hypothetical protein
MRSRRPGTSTPARHNLVKTGSPASQLRCRNTHNAPGAYPNEIKFDGISEGGQAGHGSKKHCHTTVKCAAWSTESTPWQLTLGVLSRRDIVHEER